MNPTDRLIDALRAAGCDPRETSSGWSARCPAHEDRRPSLSVAAGDDGRALIRCHSGCSTEDICRALGLTLADLMVAQTSPNGRRPTASKDRAKPSKTFASLADVARLLERQRGARSHLWVYCDSAGREVGAVVRWTKPDGSKDVRPLARAADGSWRIGAMEPPRPLFGLPELVGAEVIFVVEGEKTADAARAIGLTAVTSSGGSMAAGKSDWGPLRGKNVVILPDHDDPGERYALDVAKLARAAGAKSVKVLRLWEHAPALPAGGDLADVVGDPSWCGLLGEAAEAADLRALLEQLASEAPEWAPVAHEADERPSWRPFPLDTLPRPLRVFVEQTSKSLGCDPAFVAMPALACLAAAVGTSRSVWLKGSWTEPSVLWCATVGRSGSTKSPAFDAAVGPLRQIQVDELRDFEEREAVYLRDLTLHEKHVGQWRKLKGDEPPPEPPAKPTAKRRVTSDPTVEALAAVLAENPRGVLLARDELSGWLAGFDQYKSRRGSDVPSWLELHRAGALIVDRKSAAKRVLCVPRAAVSVAGTVQPDTLRRLLTPEFFECGLAARLLVACPPTRQKTWSASAPPRATSEGYAALVYRLANLEPGIDGEPVSLPLEADAEEIWAAWYDRHAQRIHEAADDRTAALLSKIEGAAARVALILELAGDPGAVAVGPEAVRAGCRLADWFAAEGLRVYGLLAESPEDKEARELVEWIERQGGSVTARQVQRSGPRRLREAGEADVALQDLAARGIGRWESLAADESGGRPTRVFRLATCDETPLTPAKTEVSSPADGRFGRSEGLSGDQNPQKPHSGAEPPVLSALGDETPRALATKPPPRGDETPLTPAKTEVSSYVTSVAAGNCDPPRMPPPAPAAGPLHNPADNDESWGVA